MAEGLKTSLALKMGYLEVTIEKHPNGEYEVWEDQEHHLQFTFGEWIRIVEAIKSLEFEEK